MPDFKSEMAKVINAWDKDAVQQQQKEKKPHRFVPTTGVTDAVFNYIKNAPNCTSTQVCKDLVSRGFKRASIHSLLAQFIKQGQMKKNAAGEYTVLVAENSPLKAYKAGKAYKARKARAENSKPETKPQKSQSQQVESIAPPDVASVKTRWDADTIINNIGLKQARALYDELKKIFGG